MTTNKQILALVMTTALVTSATVVVGARGAAAEPTEISSCTVIDESEEYVLSGDVTRTQTDGNDPEPCIEIRADDVTLDGAGHTVSTEGGTAISVGANSTLQNVTLHDVILRGEGENVRFDSVVDGELVNVTSDESREAVGIVVVDSEEIRIRDSTITSGGNTGRPLIVRSSERISIVNNTFPESPRPNVLEQTNESTVRGNEFVGAAAVWIRGGSDNLVIRNRAVRGSSSATTMFSTTGEGNAIVNNTIESEYPTGISVGGDNNAVRGNDVTARSFAVSVHGQNNMVTNNYLWGGDGTSFEGGGVTITGGGHEVANNTLGFGTGVEVVNPTGPISVHHNRIDAHAHVHVYEEEDVCGPDTMGADAVDLHENTFVAWDGSSQHTAYGVLNEDDDGVLDARNNYWGAADGPSSYEDGNVTDPVTDEPADGNGTSVSEGVRFDPWLDRPNNETATSAASD